MPSKNNIYTVTKVEHEFGLTKVKPKFTKMPELYLELLVNKKKVNPILASEKYIHHYEPVVSSEDSINGAFKPIVRITSQTVPENNKPLSPKKGTFNWESSDSMEPSPIIQKKVNRLVSSSPQIGSVSSNRYRKVKKSIISSYYNKVENRNNGEKQQYKYSNKQDDEPAPPPLKEIKKTFGEDKPNIQYLENNDDDDKKRELLFKFKRLKKTYPKVDLPEFNMMSNHENMKRTYDATIKNLAIDSTVEGYKSYLMMGFMGCEIALGKIGFDMEGYTQQQTLYMNKYEKLLIELGEKSYVPSSINKWPVEIRLAALVLFQTTIFIVSKIIAKKTNVNLLQMYNSVNGAYETQQRYTYTDPKVSSSGFASGGSSPLTFIPKTRRTPSTNSEGRMKGPSATRD
ncbi:hypothetical protein IIV30_070R [Invertebrate iridescent virus 30]|uniref:Uncharacterized protein n=1 Tax=Invertebrate iridescent virus 30 TaxID=345585 RepID=W8W2I5_9VIRU|nr:hypothetical protein IIV30_070R [Invertebrate iridescent virus 30]CCV02265.1 hypothetical protein IIV30_070R [Invertebrate iridescent virus 30]